MLVLIVVAAAVAFSLFVASYESQLTNEEKAAHNRTLESLHLLRISVTYPGGFPVDITFVGADVNYMNITGYEIDGAPVQGWQFYPAGVPAPPWMTTTGCLTSNTTLLYKEGCEMVAPFQTVKVVLDPDNSSLAQLNSTTTPIQLSVFTTLANEFSYSFIPPVAIASIFFVESGSGSIPVFDGTNSYQPNEPDNATLVAFAWSVAYASNGTPPQHGATGSGAEFEDGPLVNLTGKYNVTLAVQNTDGLTDVVTIPYDQP